MPQNPIQFQHGMSLSEFIDRYGSEEQCEAAVLQARWPDGFVCTECGGHEHSCFVADGRRYWQCAHCRVQTTLCSGTLFHATKLPLTTWFQAIYHLSQSKGGISSVELGRRLGVRQPTAWLLKQKLMQAMALREAAKPKLGGRVEVDDAYLGGERSGKRGRGAAGKTPFVAAVETTAEQRPRRLRLTVVKGFRKTEIGALAKTSLAPGSDVITDGLSCWPAVAEAGCRHWPMPTGSGRQAVRWAPFKWVNTALGNIKTAITGTYRAIRQKHIPRYLAEFEYRFNRRYDLAAMMPRLGWAAVRTPPMSYRLLKLAEVHA
jgi:transposase-like protein/ribosomal protein L37AE/L43A